MANLLHAEENHLYSFQGEAFEGFEADYNADFLSSNFDRVSPSADQVYVPYLDIDTKWRSISIAHPSPALFRAHGSVNDASKRGLVDRVDIYKNHPKKHNSNVIEIIPSNRINGINSVSKGSSGSSAPAQPFLLMPTHFETGAALDDIMLTVRKVLNEFPEISFASVAGEFSWDAVYLSGSTYCKIQISIYANGDTHIVEGNRLSGDSAAFRAVFAELKVNMLSTDIGSKNHSSFFDASPMPSAGLLSDEEVTSCLQPILQMAKSGKVEAQLQASRMLCDLSMRDDIQQQLCDSGCLVVLVQVLLPSTVCEQISHHALLALANLSEAQSCQGAMIDAGVLPALLTLATDGPYNTAEVSRESARILANLSSRMAARVIEVLGPRVAKNWMATVDCLVDERLKLHACRAKGYLQQEVTTV